MIFLGGTVFIPHFQHFRGRYPLRIGQVGAGHQGATQRNRIHHTENAADHAHGCGLPVGEAGPVSHHDQAGNHKNDGRKRPGRRSDGLDDIVFHDRVIMEVTQDSHGNHGSRDGSRKG